MAMVGQATRKSFAENLKYHVLEAESFREIFKEREAVRSVFVSSEKALLNKKEKLWRAKEKDVHKWGSEDNLALERIKD
jgi:thioredoxin-related protein